MFAGRVDLGATTDGAYVGELAVLELALSRLVACAYRLGLVGANPVGRQVGDSTLPFAHVGSISDFADSVAGSSFRIGIDMY